METSSEWANWVGEPGLVIEADHGGQFAGRLGSAAQEAPVLGGEEVFFAEGAECLRRVAIGVDADEEEVDLAAHRGWQGALDGFHIGDDQGAGVFATGKEEREDLRAAAEHLELYLAPDIGGPHRGDAVKGLLAVFSGRQTFPAARRDGYGGGLLSDREAGRGAARVAKAATEAMESSFISARGFLNDCSVAFGRCALRGACGLLTAGCRGGAAAGRWQAAPGAAPRAVQVHRGGSRSRSRRMSKRPRVDGRFADKNRAKLPHKSSAARTSDLPRAQVAGRPHRMPGRAHKSSDARTDRRDARTDSQDCRTVSGMSAQVPGRAHSAPDRVF